MSHKRSFLRQYLPADQEIYCDVAGLDISTTVRETNPDLGVAELDRAGFRSQPYVGGGVRRVLPFARVRR